VNPVRQVQALRWTTAPRAIGVDRWRELDLAAIVAAGFGDVPLIKLPLRCSACGALGHEIKVSGRSYELAE
jgi:hypothetical protein